jgi:hypothetical protein
MTRTLIIILASLIFFSSSFAFAWTEQRKTFFVEGGYTYEGEVNFMGIPNGKGKMYFCKPWKNESERNSLDSCPKRFEVLNGDKYEGEFIKGQRQGYGTYYFKQANNNLINNKSIIRIEGQWQNNQVSNGSFYFSDGTNFSGTLSEANDKYTSENIRLRIEQDKTKQQKLEKEQQQSKLKYLENTFGSKCSRYKNNNVEFITEIRGRGRPRVIKSEEEVTQKPKRCKTPDEFFPDRIRGRPKNPDPKPKVEKPPKPPKEPHERFSKTPQYRLDYYREKSSCPVKCLNAEKK